MLLSNSDGEYMYCGYMGEGVVGGGCVLAECCSKLQPVVGGSYTALVSKD